MSPSSHDGAAGTSHRLVLEVHLQRGAFALDARLDSTARRIAIVGPSGAGKTTCLRVLAGLERHARGHVHIDGDTWLDSRHNICRPPWQRGVGWVPQEPMLFPHLRVRANLDYARRAPKRELDELAEWLDVQHLLERWPRRLSGGEQQRVALARALLSRPRMLLLDEPFSALDRDLRTRIVGELRDYCDAHALPLLLVSHDSADVAQLAEERWELRDGHLLAP